MGEVSQIGSHSLHPIIILKILSQPHTTPTTYPSEIGTKMHHISTPLNIHFVFQISYSKIRKINTI